MPHGMLWCDVHMSYKCLIQQRSIPINWLVMFAVCHSHAYGGTRPSKWCRDQCVDFVEILELSSVLQALYASTICHVHVVSRQICRTLCTPCFQSSTSTTSATCSSAAKRGCWLQPRIQHSPRQPRVCAQVYLQHFWMASSICKWIDWRNSIQRYVRICISSCTYACMIMHSMIDLCTKC